jgi:hypothetical protein
MTTTVYQLVIGDHLARSVRGVPCAPPARAIDPPLFFIDDRDHTQEHIHGRPL